MNLELERQQRTQAIASLRQYFEQNMPEPIGDLAAGLLFDYFLEEIGPVIYNKAIADAQTRIQQRVADLPGELFEDEFRLLAAFSSKTEAQMIGSGVSLYFG